MYFRSFGQFNYHESRVVATKKDVFPFIFFHGKQRHIKERVDASYVTFTKFVPFEKMKRYGQFE